MASTTVPLTRSYPKRKRAQVSYYEASSDESDDQTEATGNKDSRKKSKTTSKASSSRPLPKRKIFPFNSLPAELKNTIYAHALTDPNGIFLISKLKAYRRTVKRAVASDIAPTKQHLGWSRGQFNRLLKKRGKPSDDSSVATTLPALVPNLLRLNRQIFVETQPILYATNDFILEDTAALHSFLAAIGPLNAAVLADVTIKAWGYSKAHKALNHPAFTLLANAVNLQRLHLDCRISWDIRPARVALQVYRDGFHWMEALGTAKGRFDAAVDIIEVLEENFASFTLSSPTVPKVSHDESMELFRNELRHLLRSH